MAPEKSSVVVAIDGPSGSGKSSASRGVARSLGCRYLDTGAMYRAMTWWMQRGGVDLDDPEAIARFAESPALSVTTDPDDPAIAVDDTDVSGAIRSRAVSNAVSAVSAVPAVRERLVRLQRELIGAGGIVVEGRDIGTVVAPDAAVKIFLTAAPDVRAQRRSAELDAESGAAVGVTLTELSRRDRLDSSRATSPLSQAVDAVVLDTTTLSLDEVVEAICALAAKSVSTAGSSGSTAGNGGPP